MRKPLVISVDSAAKWWGLLASIGSVTAGGVAYAVNLQNKVDAVQIQVDTIDKDRTRAQDEWRTWREEQTKDMASVMADLRWIRERLK